MRPPSESRTCVHPSGAGACCVGPTLVIDAAGALLLDANADGWRMWGLDPETVEPPVSIDGAMPALQRLRQHADGHVGSWEEALTFWTARGVAHLPCRIVARNATSVAVHVDTTAAAAPTGATTCLDPEHARGRADGLQAAEPAAPPVQFALSARLAHELRTPLSAVIAYAEILKDEHFGPLANARYRGYARDIYEGARHALGVVDSMLSGETTQSLVPPLAFADIEPAVVVESCLAVVRPLADRAGLELAADCSQRLPRVVADELSLKQMLLNLLANAIKFARRGDRVTVAITYDGDGPLRISVTDTGPGMGCRAENGGSGTTCAVRDGSRGGLGLGLPLTRALAAANGAAIDIASEPGRGTRVTIAFGHDRLVPV